jgi:hypothetical protein
MASFFIGKRNKNGHLNISLSNPTFYHCIRCERKVKKKEIVLQGGEIIKDTQEAKECICKDCKNAEPVTYEKPVSNSSEPFNPQLLREYPTYQHPNDRRRRWFQNKELDLIVWYEPDDTIFGFQMTFNHKSRDHTLTWKKNYPLLKLNCVDRGTKTPFKNQSPLLLQNGYIDIKPILNEFIDKSILLDLMLRETVQIKLEQYILSTQINKESELSQN